MMRTLFDAELNKCRFNKNGTFSRGVYWEYDWCF